MKTNGYGIDMNTSTYCWRFSIRLYIGRSIINKGQVRTRVSEMKNAYAFFIDLITKKIIEARMAAPTTAAMGATICVSIF